MEKDKKQYLCPIREDFSNGHFYIIGNFYTILIKYGGLDVPKKIKW